MTPERWKQIERLYHAALERDGNQRAAYLQQACAGDGELRREVESLLKRDGAGGLLERPVAQEAAKMIGKDESQPLTGKRLGPYEVLSKIGAGGMGDVYRAVDTKLRRDVAIKVLPNAFVYDPDRLSRFRREAQLLASLNHPNIAAIYRFDESDGVHYLVMELVEGKTLADRLLRDGKLPVEESMEIAKQICEALEHAHEKNIIHRDLKPANVKLTPEGKVKVLDFGLAKAFAADSADSVSDSQAPTLPPGASPTIPGAILGTAAYMSPEQARGKQVDKRTDIFALGCVFYELISGRQAFAGDSVTDILGAVMHKEPDWALLPTNTPEKIRDLLRRCLQKDNTLRLRDAGDVRIEIHEALNPPALRGPQGNVISADADWRPLMTLVIACLVTGALVAALTVWKLKPLPPKLVTRTVIALPPDQKLYVGSRTPVANALASIALSPDGSHMAFVAQAEREDHQLYIRALDNTEATPLSGTEGASMPFFSPDSQWIGFFALGRLKKVAFTGGAVQTLCEITSPPRGASWGLNGRIVFAPNTVSGLFQVSDAGGTPELLTHLNAGESTHRWPEILPSGKAVLFVSAGGTGINFDDAQIEVQRFDTGERRVLVRGGTFPHYASTGHIVYYRAGTVMAVPFDLSRLDVTGLPAPLIERVSSLGGSGSADFSFADNGSLVYLPGVAAQANQSQMFWVDRKGRAEPLKAPPRSYTGNSNGPRISPDGQQIAVQFTEAKNDIWIYSLARDTLTRLTFEGTNSNPIWTPDGKRVAYESVRSGGTGLFWKPADGSGSEERLSTSTNVQYPGSFTPDGRNLLYLENDPKTQRDLWVLPLEGDRKPRAFLQTPFNESSPRLSPDGRWVAYLSDESGRYEVYVQPYPGPGGKYQISTEGGREVVWGRNNEIFYRSGDKMMAVAVKTQPSLIVGKPQLLFEVRFLGANLTPYYDVTSDGKRFIMLRASEQPGQAAPLTQINVVQNWFEELKQKVPTGK